MLRIRMSKSLKSSLLVQQSSRDSVSTLKILPQRASPITFQLLKVSKEAAMV